MIINMLSKKPVKRMEWYAEFAIGIFMREPSLRNSRLVIAGGFIAAIALSCAGFLLGRSTSPRPTPLAETTAPAPETSVVPAEIEAPRILGRADIIALANRATDVYASGMPLPTDVTALAGRRFELALPFGCTGMAAEKDDTPLRWRYDADKETLRIHAAPISWTADDWGVSDQEMAESRFEGFWVSHPWTSAEHCPQAREPFPEDQPAIPAEHSLAVAEAIAGEEKARDPRPYKVVTRLAPQKLAADQGFRLRLMGRIERLNSGLPVICKQTSGFEQRPVCLVSISLDEVRLENPMKNETLGTWRKPTGSGTNATRPM